MNQMPRVMIAGTNSGVGKTTVTLGIMAALVKKGITVQGFKAGPDYIDPSHHTFVTGNASRNLDTWMMGESACCELFERSAADAEISVIEGVMGLYDGSIDSSGHGSSAHLAKVLNTPVILVVNARGVAQSAGAIVMGFKEFDREINLAGIILNNIASQNHYDCIKKAIEDSCSVTVLGYLNKDKDITIPERHLGLIPSEEEKINSALYEKLGQMVLETIDTDRLLDTAGAAGIFPDYNKSIFINKNDSLNITLAIARDNAFCFYYQDDIDLFEALGAKIIQFSPLNDKYLPDDIDGIFMGGGFPELFADRLMKNESMRNSILEAHKQGTVIYGECGGMMYLLEKLIDCEGRSFKMCGVLNGTSRMGNRRQGLGYVITDATCDNMICKSGDTFRSHEFHWSMLQDVPDDTMFAYNTRKSNGKRTGVDGICKNNVLASYTHIHFSSNPKLAVNLLSTMAKRSKHKLVAERT
ncbi:MAG: cobyrinate a,c-diamide synthase [Candidatus Scalindua rubra]|uniref:Cobyrinate a,c-diamide synthase n=1 Tax=Candidatus Scalindua brodae TaxID=237368 RepID=A0A0B0EHX9_9BACT|nr:MAG: cobyrinic acid a,c-diamide synthase [Candidatus Scalindua brodae]MBZ0107292.1 cobyrinate a,c-diamide synthase [Candidatus Scalindua rubra]TWU32083.1 Cobyrinic acid A,C-diamide synthase [Candidatus Brocadiaceae bacterium S225]